MGTLWRASQAQCVQLSEGPGYENAGIQVSGPLAPLPHCPHPAQNSMVCSLSPSSNMSKDTAQLGCLRPPGCMEGAHPQAIKLGRESHDMGCTKGNKAGAAELTIHRADTTDNHGQQEKTAGFGMPNCIKQVLLNIKDQININTVTAGDLNIPVTNRSIRQNEIEFNQTREQIDLKAL